MVRSRRSGRAHQLKRMIRSLYMGKTDRPNLFNKDVQELLDAWSLPNNIINTEPLPVVTIDSIPRKLPRIIKIEILPNVRHFRIKIIRKRIEIITLD